MESSDRKTVYIAKANENSLNPGMRETMIVPEMVPGTYSQNKNCCIDSSCCVPRTSFAECGGESVMKPNNVTNVSTNQAKWSNSGPKNYIINSVPVKNEVRQSIL